MLPRLTPRKIATLKESVLGKNVPKGFTLFIATESDVPALIRMAEPEFGVDTFDHAMYRHYICRGHALLFGLKHKGKIAAHVMIEFNRRQKRIYVTEVLTAKAYRGRGLAKWLWGKVFALGETLGYRTVTSHVEPANKKAIALYHQLGLETAKRLKGYYCSGRDALYMRKTLFRS